MCMNVVGALPCSGGKREAQCYFGSSRGAARGEEGEREKERDNKAGLCINRSRRHDEQDLCQSRVRLLSNCFADGLLLMSN